MQSPTTKITRSKVWTSIFRTGNPDSPYKRSLLIFNNLFLHFLPTKVKKDSLRLGATFYLGYASAILFLILVASGVLLMLYYRPSVPQAYYDMKDLAYVVTSGNFLRNMHRWAAH
ncbi:MAG: cytochrome B6, partial [Aliifodinibius sp.]|nr:cytochrome B6 [Fodinibius sp.]